MNWQRGLSRLWIALSITWMILVAVVGYYSWPVDGPAVIASVAQYRSQTDADACADARVKNPALGNPFDCFDPTNETGLQSLDSTIQTVNKRHILLFFEIGLIPPFAVLLLLFAGQWVVSGFKRPDG